MSEVEFFVASLGELEKIYAFCEKKFSKDFADPNEFILASWTAPWRRESLEHYLKTGWSFVAQKDQEIVGVYLAQPFLFVNKQTQSLWIEMLVADSTDVLKFLADIAIKTAREKHLQRVLFADYDKIKTYLTELGVVESLPNQGEWNYRKENR